MKALAEDDRAEARAVLKDTTELLGLAAAERHELSGPGGAPLGGEQAERAAQFLAASRARPPAQHRRASEERRSMNDDLRSLRERLAALPAEQRAAFLPGYPRSDPGARRATTGRSGRGPTSSSRPGDWLNWLMRSGRGAGKTRAGAEWVRAKVERGIYGRLHLVGRTRRDVRETMVEGPSGLLTRLSARLSAASTARGCGA